jgi:hypothetical protein
MQGNYRVVKGLHLVVYALNLSKRRLPLVSAGLHPRNSNHQGSGIYPIQREYYQAGSAVAKT